MKFLLRSPFDDRQIETKPLWRQYYEMLILFYSLNYHPAEYYSFRFHHKGYTYKDMLRFIPSSWFIRNVNDQLSFRSWRALFANKSLCSTFAKNKGIVVPKEYGIFNTKYGYDFNDLNNIRNELELKDFLIKTRLKKIVFKDLTGFGGKNIYFITDVIDKDGYFQLLIDDKIVTIEEFTRLLGTGEFLIQEYLENNAFLSDIYPNSINTFRVMSFLNNEREVKILGVRLKTGIGKMKVDNSDNGGLSINIDLQTGCFINHGYDYSCKTYPAHPDSNFVFKNVKIPFWHELIEFVKECAAAFPMMRFIAWDIACTNKGICLLEANVYRILFFAHQINSDGISGLVREDLRTMGYDFPEEKVPPITVKIFFQRLIQIGKKIFGIEK
jgi:hypothetical protein